MKTCRLDELADALKATLDSSQEKVDQQLAKRLRQIINVDASGQPESLSFECRLPAGDGGERQFSMLRLPLESLYQTESLQISELSIEVACKVSKSSRKRDKTQSSLTATPVAAGEDAEETHHIKIQVNQQSPAAEVSIDGEAVEEFFDEQFAPEQLKKDRRQKLQLFLKILLSLAMLGLAAAAGYLILGL